MDPQRREPLLSNSTSSLLVVRASWRPSHSASVLYLLSDPVPENVNYARFTTESHDQGWSDNKAYHGTYRHSHTWLEITIFRALSHDGLDTSSPILNQPYDKPVDCLEKLRPLGWILQASTPNATDNNAEYVWPLQHNVHADENFRQHCITWSRKSKSKADEESGSGRGDGFLSTLLPGDRIGVWARALYPAWDNFIRSAKIELAEQLDDLRDGEAEDLASTISRMPSITENPIVELPDQPEEDVECNIVHYGVLCDGPGCRGKTDEIAGIRYKCTVCLDVDFCTPCMADPSNIHDQKHPFIRFVKQARFGHAAKLPPEDKGEATAGLEHKFAAINLTEPRLAPTEGRQSTLISERSTVPDVGGQIQEVPGKDN